MASTLFDTHCHLFESGFFRTRPTSPFGVGEELDEYNRLRDAHRIERSLVIGYDEAPYSGNSDYIADLARTRPWLVPLRYVRPGDALQGDVAAYPADTSQARELCHELLAAADHGSPPRMLSLNVGPDPLVELLPAIAALTGTWFLISHLGLPGPVGDTATAQRRLGSITRLAGMDHVSVKISGQYAASAQGHPHRDVQPYLDVLGDELGMHALVWGSDFAPCLTDGAFDLAVNCLFPSRATVADREAIRYRNALAMFTRFCGDTS